MEIMFTRHAVEEMKDRRISRKDALAVARSSMRVIREGGQFVYQSRYLDEHLKKEMLLRLIVKEGLKSLKVITLYKTSKIEKYWKEEQDENSL